MGYLEPRRAGSYEDEAVSRQRRWTPKLTCGDHVYWDNFEADVSMNLVRHDRIGHWRFRRHCRVNLSFMESAIATLLQRLIEGPRNPESPSVPLENGLLADIRAAS